MSCFKEDDDTYSGIAMNLPGAGSCGDTEEEDLTKRARGGAWTDRLLPRGGAGHSVDGKLPMRRYLPAAPGKNGF